MKSAFMVVAYVLVRLDWTCGGMWANASNFTMSLNKFAKDAKHQLVVAFDGSIDCNNINAWSAKMEWDFENIKDVFARVRETGRPPFGAGSFGLW